MNIKSINNKETNYNLFNQILSIWVLDEIRKRQNEGTLPKPLNLHAAQIIFFPDNRKHIIRINEEVKAKAKIKFIKPLNYSAGDMVYQSNIESFENIILDEEEFVDCGHITMLRKGNEWTIAFDARYNKELAKKHIDKSEEFYKTAKNALRKGYHAAYIDTLFSATELALKSILLINPKNNKLRGQTIKHSTIKSLINMEVRIKNIKHDHANLYNNLSKKRPNARYLKQDLIIDITKAKHDLKITKDIIQEAKSIIQIRQ